MKNCGTDLSTYKRYIDRKITNAMENHLKSKCLTF